MLRCRFGCQTFTWEMLGTGWSGGPDDLVRADRRRRLCRYRDHRHHDRSLRRLSLADFARRLTEAGLALVSFAFGSDSGFTDAGQIAADLDTARRWVDFAAHFPGAMISMGSATVVSDGPRDEKFAIAAECYNRCDGDRACGWRRRRRPSLLAPQHAALHADRL